MKIAMPTMGDKGMDEQIGQHFGRSPTFTIYSSKKDELNIIDNHGKHRGGSKNPPELLAEEGVDVMVCSNLGRKAIDLFDDLGIDVYCGARATVKEALEAFENDELEVASLSDGCEEGRHDH